MSAMISVEEALRRVLASAETPLEEEKVALQAAYGRVLAHDLKALRTQPPFPNSAMDGYALRSADTASVPATLSVVGESAAGRAFEGAAGPGEAVRIFTGAPMPDGADTIVIQEDVSREGERIRLSAPVPAGDNLRPAGMDFQTGEILIPAGHRLGPRDVALAAAANHADLMVRRRARVAILATGDELVAPGGELGPAQIVASNNFAVAGLVEAYGGVAIDLGIAIDEMNATKAAISLDQPGDGEIVGRDDLRRPQFAAGRDQFIAGRQNGDPGAAADHQVGVVCRRGQRHVPRARL